MLLAKNADIFSSNNKNYSPLRLALKAGGSVMNWIITSQTIKACDGSKNTVLHYAAEWGLEDAIELLIKKGADISAKNASGETPLFNALMEYVNRDTLPFHVPGHKKGVGMDEEFKNVLLEIFEKELRVSIVPYMKKQYKNLYY